MNASEYQENRLRFPLGELAKYNGQWVAFSLDGRRILANSDDLATLDRLKTYSSTGCVTGQRAETPYVGCSSRGGTTHV